MTFATIGIFMGGALIGISTIILIIGLCIASGRSALEVEIMELYEINSRQQHEIEMLNDQLENRKEEIC